LLSRDSAKIFFTCFWQTKSSNRCKTTCKIHSNYFENIPKNVVHLKVVLNHPQLAVLCMPTNFFLYQYFFCDTG
jgi:hypothetical protein